MSAPESRYIGWLKSNGVPLVEAYGVYWRIYNNALTPASPAPHFVELNRTEGTNLLKRSRAWMLRYCSGRTESETCWWYVICDRFDPTQISSRLRNQIKHSKQNCSVKSVEAAWLADRGYSTYLAAHHRYANASPMAEDMYRSNVLGTKHGPVEYWGVFVQGNLAAYCQCTLDDSYVDMTVTRFDPQYMKFFVSHALITYLLEHYVIRLGMVVGNGERSIAHQTNIQQFLLRFGFRKQFCRLNLVYQPWLGSAVRVLFPVRRIVNKLPDRGLLHSPKVLLVQEEIRRSCL